MNQFSHNSNSKILAIIVFLLSFFSSKTQAQQSTSDTSQWLVDEVIITENRYQTEFKNQNKNIEVITSAQIKKMPVQSLNELLSFVSGVDVRQRGAWGTQADIGIDGGSFDQTLLLLNGTKIADPQTGHNMMNIPVPLEAIERIEIIRGPAARTYGLNALSGVINIITKTPQNTSITAHLMAGSSFKKDDSTGKTYTGWGAEIRSSWNTKFLNQQLAFSHFNGNGYRYNTAYNSNRMLYQNQIKASDKASINLTGGFVSNGFGANGYYAAPADIESKETVKTAIGIVDAQIDFNKVWTLKPRLSYRFNKDDYIFVRQKPEVYRNIHQTNVWDLELNNIFHTKIGTFGLGLEWRQDNISSARLGNNMRDNFGVFAEYHFEYKNIATINAGAYINYNSVYGWNVFPGIDAGLNITKHLRAYTSFGTGQRIPTYTDLFYKGPANIGNPNLKPEQMLQPELGLRYSSIMLSANAAYFYRHGSNFIDWARTDTTQPWQPENYNILNTHGFTLATNFRFIPEEKYANFQAQLGISYTYLSPKADVATDENGNTVLSKYTINSLKHQFISSLNLNFFNKVNLSLNGRYNQRFNAANVSGFTLSSYFILDAKLAYSAKHWSVYLAASNLLDVQYIESGLAPLPGRWMNVGFRLSL